MQYLQLTCAAILSVILYSCTRGDNTNQLPTCTEISYSYQGYTYNYQQNHRVWSHCKFYQPNSVDSRLCGITRTWRDVHICDPDSLLVSARTNTSLGKSCTHCNLTIHQISCDSGSRYTHFNLYSFIGS